MFDSFLTTTLQIVIVIDILGAIAYFVLGGLKARAHRAQLPEIPAQERPTSRTLWSFLPWRSPLPQVVPTPSPESAFASLKRVLYSYEEGLA